MPVAVAKPIVITPSLDLAATRIGDTPHGPKDVPFAFLFFANVGIIAYYAVAHGLRSLNAPDTLLNSTATDFNTTSSINGTDTTESNPFNSQEKHAILGIICYIVIISGAFAMCALHGMLKCAKNMIKVAFMMQIILFALGGLLWLANGSITVGLIFLALALLLVGYWKCIQDRIPFAAANLTIACRVIEENYGVVFISYVMLIFQFAWIVAWALAVLGLQYINLEAAGGMSVDEMCDDQYMIQCAVDPSCTNAGCAMNQCYEGYTCHRRRDGGGKYNKKFKYECECDYAADIAVNPGVYFMLLIAFYWGLTVVKNVVHVTVCGTAGSWWGVTGGNSGADLSHSHTVVTHKFCRAMTTNFGSICLGSLIVAILKAIETAVEKSNKDDDSSAGCVLECILTQFRQLVEYFNKWAYVYVGVYGQSFINAGKSVFALIKSRGWTAIVNDDLIDNVLSMTALAVGCLASGLGCIAVAAEVGGGIADDRKGGAYSLVGIVCFFVGWGMASVLMVTISSAVTSVFVCFAHSPDKLQEKHPPLHYDLVEAWDQLASDFTQHSAVIAKNKQDNRYYRTPDGARPAMPMAHAVPVVSAVPVANPTAVATRGVSGTQAAI
jgi:hypothetical protein